MYAGSLCIHITKINKCTATEQTVKSGKRRKENTGRDSKVFGQIRFKSLSSLGGQECLSTSDVYEGFAVRNSASSQR